MLSKPKRCFSHSRKIVRELYSRFRRHNISYTAGQIAYFFILSVFPFLIFVNALIASFDIPGNAAISFLEPLFPEQIVSFIAQYLEYINAQ
ncbi:MAG: YihY/virulence factor BrkB family protein, partial [Oscillospiraceae bacterium]|nr:YihY/virulence factor BrkB family protein [Oscillospiraceae bacterium]